MADPVTARSLTRAERIWASALVWLLFVATIPMPLLYHSNQNTKFLQGLASAFPERLGNDWTAHTADGLPAFTLLVDLIARFTHPNLYYLLEILLLGVMCLSLLAIARLAAPRQAKSAAFWIITGSLVVIFVHDWQDDTLRGVAGQYLTHGYLQPAEFGILFLPALVLAHRRHSAALPLAALPAVFHPAYIAYAALICAIVLFHHWRNGARPGWGLIALSAACLVLPPLDLALRFAPSDPETFAQANQILAFERIPHHSDPAHWADFAAFRKLLVAMLAAVLAPRGPIRQTLIALLLLAGLGTGFVWLTGNAEIALAAPWRASVIIAPVAAMVLVGRVTGWVLERPIANRYPALLCLPFAVFAVVAAGTGAWEKLDRVRSERIPQYAAFAAETYRPGDLYLTSPAHSSFRLAAMVPVVATWKTHPYLDTEVLEWRRRVTLAAAVFGPTEAGTAQTPIDCTALDALLAAYPATHLMLRNAETARYATCPRLEELHASDGWIYRITPE